MKTTPLGESMDPMHLIPHHFFSEAGSVDRPGNKTAAFHRRGGPDYAAIVAPADQRACAVLFPYDHIIEEKCV